MERQGTAECRPESQQKEVFEMASWIRSTVKRLGSALETKQVSPVEYHQARLLGDPVARYDHKRKYAKKVDNRTAYSGTFDIAA